MMEETHDITIGIEFLEKFLPGVLRTDRKTVTNTTAIYRYMSKAYFLDLIENKSFVLPHISLWNDPLEGFIFKTGSNAEKIRRLYAGFYGQSWTFGKNMSDLRWRAYCPNGDGVRIKTTVGKLGATLNGVLSHDDRFSKIVAGPISYVPDDMFGFGNSNCKLHSLVPTCRQNAASLLFIKRTFFKWENEYRIVCHVQNAVQRETAENPQNAIELRSGLLKCKIPDLNTLIDEVYLDPRMSQMEVDRTMCRFAQSDFSTPVRQSDIYRWPDFQLD